MNKNCPSCGGSYNITPQHVGRSFACQKCGAALVVQPSGLTIAGQPQHVTAGPVAPQGGFDPMQADYSYQQPAHRESGGPSPLMDFLMFRRMIAPLVIMIIFWLGTVGSILGGLGTIVMGAMARYGQVSIMLSGLMMLIFGPLAVRIYCELTMLLFRINETLTDIRGELRKQNQK